MISHTGDDFLLNRLFSYLNNQLPWEIEYIKPFGRKIYLVESSLGPFILKSFRSFDQLIKQQLLLADLKKAGFHHTYSFLFEEREPLFFEKVYYGCLEYIPPSMNPFNFNNPKDRQDGLTLLSKFHQSTERMVTHTTLEKFPLVHKWRSRVTEFINNLSVIKLFVKEEMLHELLAWSAWALEGVEREWASINAESVVVLHGDLAHHNFIRSTTGELYLIDFDLISIGNRRIDYLQYANRILPSINWSFEELSKFEKMKPFLNEKFFLYGLAFPTDILREWNRLIREKQYDKPEFVRQLLDFTVSQFNARRQFFYQIQRMVVTDRMKNE
ncbi:phosphotransferase [Bacillaceae bacterium CLA-AA-H227]|uniref:Phosphotransferase n=1 Tax=Robertmurraya yapensis (ex Hitch et al 2024) TaxID=3133160 RepID=A0ACC6SB83_9BACI